MSKLPKYDLRECDRLQVIDLCEKYHGYKGGGSVAVYSFGVFENDEIVAGYLWQPPPPGAVKSICPEAGYGVLALSRMVAVPKDERKLKHVSKPLKRQMKSLIDRGRWPVLVTYSDEGQGHTGYVYKCSGWTPTMRAKRATCIDSFGIRKSSYSAGNRRTSGLTRTEDTYIQRWEHWACARGEADVWIEKNGFKRVPILNKKWKSGNQAFTIVKDGEI